MHHKGFGPISTYIQLLQQAVVCPSFHLGFEFCKLVQFAGELANYFFCFLLGCLLLLCDDPQYLSLFLGKTLFHGTKVFSNHAFDLREIFLKGADQDSEDKGEVWNLDI